MSFREGRDLPKFIKQSNNGATSRMTNSFSFGKTKSHILENTSVTGKQGPLVTQPELKPKSVWLQSPFSTHFRKEVTETQFSWACPLLGSFTLQGPF